MRCSVYLRQLNERLAVDSAVVNVIEYAAHRTIRFKRFITTARRALLKIARAARDWHAPALQRVSLSESFPRRHGEFSTNIVGVFSLAVVTADFTIIGGPTKYLTWRLPRIPRP
jgi:hypothetical protein